MTQLPGAVRASLRFRATAGGGLTPWAVIGSQATDGEIGATAFITRTGTQDYALTAVGAAIGIDDRVELSLARQALNVNVVVPDTTLKLDIWRSPARALPRTTGKTCSSPGGRRGFRI